MPKEWSWSKNTISDLKGQELEVLL
jgi:hypothetical protein